EFGLRFRLALRSEGLALDQVSRAGVGEIGDQPIQVIERKLVVNFGLQHLDDLGRPRARKRVDNRLSGCRKAIEPHQSGSLQVMTQPILIGRREAVELLENLVELSLRQALDNCLPAYASKTFG